jgi:hypothetical protein
MKNSKGYLRCLLIIIDNYCSVSVNKKAPPLQDVINDVNFIYDERVGEGGQGVENKSKVQDD